MALNHTDEQSKSNNRSMLEWSPTEEDPKRQQDFENDKDYETSLRTRRSLRSSLSGEHPQPLNADAEKPAYRKPGRKPRRSRLVSSSDEDDDDDMEDGNYETLQDSNNLKTGRRNNEDEEVANSTRYSFRERAPADYRERPESAIFYISASEEERKLRRITRGSTGSLKRNNTRGSNNNNNLRQQTLEDDSAHDSHDQYPSRRRSTRLNPNLGNDDDDDDEYIDKEDEKDDDDDEYIDKEDEKEDDEDDEDEDNSAQDDGDSVVKNGNRSLRSRNRRQLGETIDEPRYSLRNRSKLQREIVNVSSHNNRLRKSRGDAFADYAKRLERRAESRRRHFMQNANRRRRHYDSSSESSVANGDSEDAGFHHAERKRYKRELNAIQPVNGFAPNSRVERATLKNIRRSDAEPLEIDKSITWDSVGGLKKHIQALKEMVMLPLLYPEFFDKYHVTPPCGILFYGAPGTGKTLLARALANSCSLGGQHVTFFMRKGADCLSKWVGEAERQLRLLFEQAKRAQPSIIFFDEIDGLAPVRSSKQDQIHASIVSTLLALMDGLDARGQVIVIGATNRVDAVDPALRRPGRFDRELAFSLPSCADRYAILDINTKLWKPSLTPSFKAEIAASTVGYCGADIKALCAETALNALRRHYPQIYGSQQKLVIDVNAVQVTKKDFFSAMKSITPAAHRSAITFASPLPLDIACLLDTCLHHLCRSIEENFKIFQISENPLSSEIHSLEEEQEDDFLDTQAAVSNEECEVCKGTGDLLCCSSCPVAIHKTCIPSGSVHDTDGSWFCMDCQENQKDDKKPTHLTRYNVFSAASATMHHGRYLINGMPGLGQQYIGAALLHKLERYTVFSLDLPRLISDHTASSPEQALVRILTEARRCVPCILYLPQIEVWWTNASQLMHSTFQMLLDDLPSSLAILLIATANVEFQDLPDAIQAFFDNDNNNNNNNNNNKESSRDGSDSSGIFSLSPPEAKQREVFFHSVYVAAMQPPAQPKEKRQLEVLPLAPSVKKDLGPDKEELLALQEKDMHYLRELRVFLDKALEFCLTQKRYAVFARRVDPAVVPDYYSIIKKPMDLGKMSEKLNDGEYLCFEDFLEDMHLIVRNAQEYNPKHSASRVIAHSACNMVDNVHSYAYRFIQHQGYDLFAKCKKLSEKIRKNNLTAKVTAAQIMSKEPIHGLAKNFHTGYDSSKSRSSARLRGESAPDCVVESIVPGKMESEENHEGMEKVEEQVALVDPSHPQHSQHSQHSDSDSHPPNENLLKQEVVVSVTTSESDNTKIRNSSMEEYVVVPEKEISSTTPPQQSFEIKLDMHVLVKARTFPGVNKLGGVAKITAVNGDGSFDVKYILGGSEKAVRAEYIHEYSSENLASTIKMSRATKENQTKGNLLALPVLSYFDSNIWPELHLLGWNRNGDLFYPPGITDANGEIGLDIFGSSDDVIEYIRQTPELAARCFGTRYTQGDLDAKVVCFRNGDSEETTTSLVENSEQRESSIKKRSHSMDQESGSSPSKRLRTTLSSTECDGMCESSEPLHKLEEQESKSNPDDVVLVYTSKKSSQPQRVVVHEEKLKALLLELVRKTEEMSIDALQALRAELHKIVYSYRKLYDRSHLTEELQNRIDLIVG